MCLLPIIYLVILYFHHSKSKRNSLKIFKSLFILNKSVIVNAFSIGLVLHSTDIDNYYHCRLWPMMIQWWTPLYYPLTLPPWRVLCEVSTYVKPDLHLMSQHCILCDKYCIPRLTNADNVHTQLLNTWFNLCRPLSA